MHHHLTSLLMRPSFFSGSVTTLITLIILGAANWSYLLEQVFFYDYFFGPEGLVTNLQESPSNRALADSVVGGDFANNLALLGFATVVGFAVYAILQLLTRLRGGTSSAWAALHSQTDRSLAGLVRIVAVRIALALLWLIYTFISVKLILPFCITAAQVGIRELWAWHSILYIIFGFTLLWIALHLHVICMRLMLLRPRVFGGNDDIIANT